MSSWREVMAKIIAATIARVGRADEKKLRAELSKQWRWGDRKMWPYKVWLSEINAQIGRLGGTKNRDVNTPDLFAPQPTGQQLRDEGMARAVDHADEVVPAWSEGALDYVKAVAATEHEVTAEKVRQYAMARGFVEPPDRRAWGAVMIRAAKVGVLTKGPWTEATDPKVHRNAVRLWTSNICQP